MDPRVFWLISFVTVSSTVLMLLTRMKLVVVSCDLRHVWRRLRLNSISFLNNATSCNIMTAVSIATFCDGQFLLSGASGSFSSSAHQYNSSSFCRWIIKYRHTHTHAHRLNRKWFIFPPKFKTMSSGLMKDFLFRSASRGLKQKITWTFWDYMKELEKAKTWQVWRLKVGEEGLENVSDPGFILTSSWALRLRPSWDHLAADRSSDCCVSFRWCQQPVRVQCHLQGCQHLQPVRYATAWH